MIDVPPGTGPFLAGVVAMAVVNAVAGFVVGVRRQTRAQRENDVLITLANAMEWLAREKGATDDEIQKRYVQALEAAEADALMYERFDDAYRRPDPGETSPWAD